MHALKYFFSGLSVRQQYVCLRSPDLPEKLRVFLVSAGHEAIDVTGRHVFIGYKPVVIGLMLNDSIADTNGLLEFRHHSSCIATLRLKKIFDYQAGKALVNFYEATAGHHNFLNAFHRMMNGVRESLRRTRAGNVSLEGNLHDQVRIAYSLPRLIALGVVGLDQRFNVFPTDLHGKISETHYVSSLRIGGHAQQQVERAGRLIIALIRSDQFQVAYELGKNHMRELRPRSAFPLSEEITEHFKLPIPRQTTAYIELDVEGHRDVGIHRIFFYRIKNEQHLSEAHPLSHIHQYYAQWRIDHGLQTEMLSRNT